MAEQKIELRQIREFGQNINDTFLFIRQNFGPLFKSFFALCAVFMLMHAIFSGLYQSRSLGMLKEIMGGRGADTNALARFFNINYWLVLLSVLLTFVSMAVALSAYLKCYLKNREVPPAIEDVWAVFQKYFFKVLLYHLLIYPMILIGCVFCLIPGIYLWVVFVPFPLVMVIEEKDFGDSFQRCFQLIRENFWMSLAIYFIAYIIYGVSGLIVGTTSAAIIGMIGYLTPEDITKSYAVATSFLNIFAFSFYCIFFISAALNYFSLAEQRDGTGILNRIDSIGKNNDNFDNIEEQY